MDIAPKQSQVNIVNNRILINFYYNRFSFLKDSYNQRKQLILNNDSVCFQEKLVDRAVAEHYFGLAHSKLFYSQSLSGIKYKQQILCSLVINLF